MKRIAALTLCVALLLSFACAAAAEEQEKQIYRMTVPFEFEIYYLWNSMDMINGFLAGCPMQRLNVENLRINNMSIDDQFRVCFRSVTLNCEKENPYSYANIYQFYGVVYPKTSDMTPEMAEQKFLDEHPDATIVERLQSSFSDQWDYVILYSVPYVPKSEI